VGRPRYLDEAGYRSTTSERIRSTSQKQSPDVIILDLMTPVMDGFEVLDALQRDERTADVPVLVVSAMKDARERCKELGAIGFLAKPFDVDDLLHAGTT
jgi:CheY-like chemotaxis protein